MTSSRPDAARPAATASRCRSSTSAAVNSSERMTIAERRAHTMQAIKASATRLSAHPSSPPSPAQQTSPKARLAASPPLRASPSSPTRSVPRVASPPRHASTAPRAPSSPTRSAPRVASPSRRASAAPRAPIESTPAQASVPMPVLVPAPTEAPTVADADETDELDADISAFEQKVQRLIQAREARRRDEIKMLDDVAAKLAAFRNEVLELQEKQRRRDEQLESERRLMENRAKDGAIAFEARAQVAADSIATMEKMALAANEKMQCAEETYALLVRLEDLTTLDEKKTEVKAIPTADCAPLVPFKLSKQSPECADEDRAHAKVCAPQDPSCFGASFSSTSSDDTSEDSDSSYSSEASTSPSAASDSCVGLASSFAASRDSMPGVYEHSTGSTTPRSSIKRFLTLKFGKLWTFLKVRLPRRPTRSSPAASMAKPSQDRPLPSSSKQPPASVVHPSVSPSSRIYTDAAHGETVLPHPKVTVLLAPVAVAPALRAGNERSAGCSSLQSRSWWSASSALITA